MKFTSKELDDIKKAIYIAMQELDKHKDNTAKQNLADRLEKIYDNIGTKENTVRVSTTEYSAIDCRFVYFHNNIAQLNLPNGTAMDINVDQLLYILP